MNKNEDMGNKKPILAVEWIGAAKEGVKVIEEAKIK